MKKRFLILTGGTLKKEFLTAFLQNYSFEKIICVDGALELAEKAGISFDYLVGDFDTVNPAVLEGFLKRKEEKHLPVTVRKFRPEKDNTDTDIAIELAISEKAEEIVLLGATGTRIDHTLGNIQLLLKPLKAGVAAFIYDEYNKIYLIEKETRFYKDRLYGPYLSFVPFGGTVKGVSQIGFKYETHKVDFAMGESLGISNELLNEEGYVSFESGRFLVIEAKETP